MRNSLELKAWLTAVQPIEQMYGNSSKTVIPVRNSLNSKVTVVQAIEQIYSNSCKVALPNSLDSKIRLYNLYKRSLFFINKKHDWRNYKADPIQIQVRSSTYT